MTTVALMMILSCADSRPMVLPEMMRSIWQTDCRGLRIDTCRPIAAAKFARLLAERYRDADRGTVDRECISGRYSCKTANEYESAWIAIDRRQK